VNIQTRLLLSLVLLLLLAIQFSAFARIGETEEQIEARYGKPIADVSRPEIGKAKAYVFSGFEIAVIFANSTSQAELMGKRDHTPIDANEIQLLLKANGNGHSWKSVESPKPFQQKWRRDDDALVAIYFEDSKSLHVTSDNFVSSAAAKMRHDDEHKLKDF
jgi:hypothetical protein